MNEVTKTNKLITIIVNGREKTIDDKELTYNEILVLAYDPVPTGELICFTVSVRRCHGNQPPTELDEGDTLKPKKGMIFNVSFTDKS